MDDRPSRVVPWSMGHGPSSVLVLGLGNPILGDDGVGWRVVEAAQEEWRRNADDRRSTIDHQTSLHRQSSIVNGLSSSVEFDYFSRGGLALMERLIGYDRAILVDAIQTQDGHPGDIHSLHPGAWQRSLHSGSAHDLSLSGALQLGRKLGMAIPEDSAIKIIAIQVEDVQTLAEELTPAVKAAIPRAVAALLALL